MLGGWSLLRASSGCVQGRLGAGFGSGVRAGHFEVLVRPCVMAFYSDLEYGY